MSDGHQRGDVDRDQEATLAAKAEVNAPRVKPVATSGARKSCDMLLTETNFPPDFVKQKCNEDSRRKS